MACVGRLHVITDEELQGRFSHLELASQALSGGADIIQFREKRPKPAGVLIAIGVRIAAECRRRGKGLIVDDRADVALAAGAAGVHLGKDDLDVKTARAILGPKALIGGTANSLEEAARVARSGVDYLGVGPVFGTTSKANPAPELGLEALRAICATSRVPVIAIGGITPERVQSVMEAGAHGLAVLAAVVCRPDPRAATIEFREALHSALKQVV